MASFMHSVKQFNEFNRISRNLSEKQINFIGLKGCVLRSLYPIPELRTMGDFDILIKEEHMPDIKQIFVEMGYSIQNDYVGIICTKNNIVWEIFVSLDEEIKVNTQYWDKQFIEKATEINSIKCLDITLFFIHILIHTGRHYVSEGAGIRNLCDIVLFLNRYKNDINFELVEAVCKEQGYYKMFCHLLNAAGAWFDANISGIDTIQTDTDGFMEYMLLNGIFGKHDNIMLPQLVKKANGSENSIKKLLFPNAASLKHRYKYLNKAPYLLPFCLV